MRAIDAAGVLTTRCLQFSDNSAHLLDFVVSNTVMFSAYQSLSTFADVN